MIPTLMGSAAMAGANMSPVNNNTITTQLNIRIPFIAYLLWGCKLMTCAGIRIIDFMF
jgi:hypothetical protein